MNFSDNFFKRVEKKTKVNRDTILSLAKKIQENDMKNEKTGWEISHTRAEINKLKSYIKDELKPRLRGLKQLYYSMNRSKKFNADSYENHMLQKQMKNIENEIEIVKLAIDDLQDDLNQYLDNKDNIYKSLRRNRKLKGDLNEQAKNI